MSREKGFLNKDMKEKFSINKIGDDLKDLNHLIDKVSDFIGIPVRFLESPLRCFSNNCNCARIWDPLFASR